MSISESLLPEFDEEMAATRRVLERVPDDDPEWRPHPKSFPISHLAQLIATMPDWIRLALTETELDLGSGGGGYRAQPTAALLEIFDRCVAATRDAIVAANDADYQVPWSLKMGEQVFYTLPRIAVIRQNISHLSHHRGQMTVYLRLRDVPVPSVYGPTADEGWVG